MFQVRHGGVLIAYAGSIEGAREIVRCELPGRYHITVIRAEPFAFGLTSRSWGHLNRHADGQIEDEPLPWESLPGEVSRASA
jgi:hypothetical protein